MENKLNIAELLKDCPKGMELYSTIYGTVYFEGVRDTGYAVLIDIKTSCNKKVQFYPDGKFNTYYSDSEMTLFPSKDVRTWEGFVPPCKFKDGDIIYAIDQGNEYIFIFKHILEHERVYCYLSLKGDDLRLEEVWVTDYNETHRLASDEEKQKLFKAIKDKGYKWNTETKTIERLSPSPKKFDISTLIPFESMVLVRDEKYEKWFPAMWGFYDKETSIKYPYQIVGATCFSYCIPYEGNESLLGTKDDCDDFFKTWE